MWALWEDAGRWPEWNDRIASAELFGELREGAIARIRFKRSPVAMKFTVVAFEDGRLLTDETRYPGARLGHEHRVERTGGETQIAHRLYLDGPAEGLWALLLGRQLRTAVRSFGERERALAEASA